MNRILRSPLSRVFTPSAPLLLRRQWRALPPPSSSPLAPLHFKPPFSSFTATQPGSPTSSEYLDKFEASPAPLESKVAPQNLFSGSFRAPKIVIFWDIEHYEVPHDVRPEDVAVNIRLALQKHPAIQGNIFRFSAYGDFKCVSKNTAKGLLNVGVQLMHVPRRTKNGSKTTVIKDILVDAFTFSFNNPPPATIVLIAELVDVAIELGARGYTIILVVSPNVEVPSMPWNASTFVFDWQTVMKGGVVRSGSAEGHLNSSDGMLMPHNHHLCGGTYISNTREAKAFALLSEEGIAKGVRHITAVTTDLALEAMKRAELLEWEVIDVSKDDINTLEKKVASLKNCMEQASIPAAMTADIKKKILLLQAEVTKAKKKIEIQAENLKEVVKVATEEAEVAISGGRSFSVSYLDVGLDAAAAREAVQKAVLKGIPVMVFSKDEDANKALVYAGVPPKADKYKESDLHEWLTSALEPLKGNGGKPKGGLCSGQGKDASGLEEAMNVAKKFAELKFS